MDDEYTAPELAHWRTRFKDASASLWSWFERWNNPKARRAVRAGAWTVRALKWRERVVAYTANTQALRERAQESLGVLFSVAPFVQRAAPSNIAAGDEQNWTPPIPARARIVANPVSGSMRGVDGLSELRATAIWLTEHGLPTEVAATARVGHAVELAREAVAAGREMVIAAGGDGTLNDVIQGLAGSTTALGVLPMGTVNVWAREIGIPLGAREAREVLLHGVRRQVDLGRAGPRYFLMMAGVGFDAEVVKRVERNWLKRVGLKMLDYIATAGSLGLTQQPAKLTLRIAGQRHKMNALMVVIGNTRLYGGAMQFTRRAVADDGLLDVVVIGGGGWARRAGVFLRAFLRRPSLGPDARYERARSVRLESTPPLPVQVDGDIIGSLPMTFSVAPGALSVIVPRAAPRHLFSRSA
jgi:YegS/Rv2252/BmrU family lipid kinase